MQAPASMDEVSSMNKNRIIGSGKQIKGSIKEAIGKLVGSARLQVEGKVEQAEGKAQNMAGTYKNTLKS